MSDFLTWSIRCAIGVACIEILGATIARWYLKSTWWPGWLIWLIGTHTFANSVGNYDPSPGVQISSGWWNSLFSHRVHRNRFVNFSRLDWNFFAKTKRNETRIFYKSISANTQWKSKPDEFHQHKLIRDLRNRRNKCVTHPHLNKNIRLTQRLRKQKTFG